MPNTLMQLMRHENIETTMKYYVGRNAQRQAEVIWAAFEQVGKGKKFDAGNTLGNTVPADERFGDSVVPATSYDG